MHHTDYKRALTQRFSLERITSALQNSHNRRLLHGIMLTLAGGSLWGANATLSKIIMDTYAISPLWLACIREIFAALLFLLCAYKQTPDKVRAVFEHPSSLISIALVAYDAILLSQVSYLQAINWTNSATATILQNICVIFVMVYVCVVNRRAPKRREIAGLILAIVGTFFICTGGDPSKFLLPPEGLMWGLSCALAAAILAIHPLALIEAYGNFVVNGFAFLVAGTTLACVVQPWNHLPVLDVQGVIYLIATVVLGTFGAYALFLEGVKEVGSVKGSMLGTSEPLAATITAAVVGGAVFSPGELFGFALIIIMVFLTA